MITRSEVVKLLMEEIDRCRRAPDLNGCEMQEEWQRTIDVCSIAVNAILKQVERENPKPLTLDELRGMKDEPVYLKLFDPLLSSGWHIIKAITSDKIIYRGWQTVYTKIDGLGIDYNLYRHKPEV